MITHAIKVMKKYMTYLHNWTGSARDSWQRVCWALWRFLAYQNGRSWRSQTMDGSLHASWLSIPLKRHIAKHHRSKIGYILPGASWKCDAFYLISGEVTLRLAGRGGISTTKEESLGPMSDESVPRRPPAPLSCGLCVSAIVFMRKYLSFG